jgi:uncharacterized protein
MPSFDCNKAINKVEKAICSNTSLANLDYKLATIYKEIREQKADKETFIKKQRAWLLKRNRSCERSTDIINCLHDIYTKRITEITSDPLISAAPFEDHHFTDNSFPDNNFSLSSSDQFHDTSIPFTVQP